MLNEINKQTEVRVHSEKNLTSFTIPIGLHPKDIDKIMDLIANELMNECEKTKASILSINQEWEYVQGTLNIRSKND